VTNGIRSLTDGYNTDDSNHSNNLLPRDAMHSADCGVEICLSVDLFVHLSACLSHAGILSKQLNRYHQSFFTIG